VQFDPDEWGTVAAWVGSVGSAGALLIALGLLRQDRKERRDRAHEERWAQARRVTVSISRMSRGGFQQTVVGRELREAGPYTYDATADVTNNSPDPIRVLSLDVSIGPVLAGQLKEPSVVHPMKAAQVAAHLGNAAEGDLRATASATFSDLLGRRWAADEAGGLLPADEPG
jgi:hypothetical protein